MRSAYASASSKHAYHRIKARRPFNEVAGARRSASRAENEGMRGQLMSAASAARGKFLALSDVVSRIRPA